MKSPAEKRMEMVNGQARQHRAEQQMFMQQIDQMLYMACSP